VLYDVVNPGGSYDVDTYVAHDWQIAGSGGGCLGIFNVDDSGQIVITSP
jgi:hypothetical protein